MPVMKITVSFAVPDSGLRVLKRCAYQLEGPFFGFLKSLVERQARWAPPGKHIDALELAVDIETQDGERTCREFEQRQLRQTRELLRRLRDKGFRVSPLQHDERLAA